MNALCKASQFNQWPPCYLFVKLHLKKKTFQMGNKSEYAYF